MTNELVVRLEQELRGLAAERTGLIALQAHREMSGGCLREVDALFAAHSEKWHPTMRTLADTPAETIAGILAKLRVLATSMVDGGASEYDEDILLLAITDLERLAITSL